MEIYLVRHGIAVGREEDMPDTLRPLTEKGRKRFRKTARAFARLGRKIGLILTSPLVRAVQTAEILAGETKHGEVGVLEELDPKFGIRSLLEAIAKRADGTQSIALVGHDPQLSSVLAALTGVPVEDLDFKKGAIVRLDTADPSKAGSADARWSLNPRSKNARRGPPLVKAEGEDSEREDAGGGARRPKTRRPRRGRAGRRRRTGAVEAAETTPPAENSASAESSIGAETGDAAGAAASAASAEHATETTSESRNSVSQSGPESPPPSP
jgi:phosphohistidine phosphatase